MIKILLVLLLIVYGENKKFAIETTCPISKTTCQNDRTSRILIGQVEY